MLHVKLRSNRHIATKENVSPGKRQKTTVVDYSLWSLS